MAPCSMVWNWRVLRAGPMPFYWPCCSLTFCLLLFSLSLLHPVGWFCGVGVFGLKGVNRSLPALHCQPFLIIIIITIIIIIINISIGHSVKYGLNIPSGHSVKYGRNISPQSDQIKGLIELKLLSMHFHYMGIALW